MARRQGWRRLRHGGAAIGQGDISIDRPRRRRARMILALLRATALAAVECRGRDGAGDQQYVAQVEPVGALHGQSHPRRAVAARHARR